MKSSSVFPEFFFITNILFLISFSVISIKTLAYLLIRSTYHKCKEPILIGLANEIIDPQIRWYYWSSVLMACCKKPNWVFILSIRFVLESWHYRFRNSFTSPGYPQRVPIFVGPNISGVVYIWVILFEDIWIHMASPGLLGFSLSQGML